MRLTCQPKAGYYQGYEAYYDPNAYQPYAAPQAPVSVHPPQPPVGPPPVAPSPSATPLEAAPGAEDDTKEPARETEEVIQVGGIDLGCWITKNQDCTFFALKLKYLIWIHH